MQPPFYIVVERPGWLKSRPKPSRRGLLAGLAAIAAVVVGGLTIPSSLHQGASSHDRGTLQVTSIPEAATVEIDGSDRGRTPLDLALPPGSHRLRLRRNGYLDQITAVQLGAAEVVPARGELWLRTPIVVPIRPPLPGAVLEGATFTADGRLALDVSVSPRAERQLWLTDSRGELRRLGPPGHRGGLALSPDGTRIAYLAPRPAPSGDERRLRELWLTGTDGQLGARRYALSDDAEQLTDDSWSPDGRHLLLVSREATAGGGQCQRLRLLDTSGGEHRDLIVLPSEVVPGSYAWRPDGQQVAFLTRAGRITALCLLTVSGEFRYLGDVGRDDRPALPFAPISWSPDGQRIIYSVLNKEGPGQGGWLVGPRSTLALFVADAEQPLGRRLGNAAGQSPVWRGDGRILALARPKATGPMVLREVGEGDEPRDLAELPLDAASTFAAHWDPARAQALVATRSATGATGGTEHWLVRFRDDEAASEGGREAAR